MALSSGLNSLMIRRWVARYGGGSMGNPARGESAAYGQDCPSYLLRERRSLAAVNSTTHGLEVVPFLSGNGCVMKPFRLFIA